MIPEEDRAAVAIVGLVVCCIVTILGAVIVADVINTARKLEAIKAGAREAVMVCAFTSDVTLQTQCVGVK